MDVKSMAETLITWTLSCTNSEQLEVIDGMIDRYLIKRYQGEKELAHHVSKVLMALREQSANLHKAPFSDLIMN